MHLGDFTIVKIIFGQGCYPELQILWLMTKAWNCGIHLFRCDIRVVSWTLILLRTLPRIGFEVSKTVIFCSQL